MRTTLANVGEMSGLWRRLLSLVTCETSGPLPPPSYRVVSLLRSRWRSARTTSSHGSEGRRRLNCDLCFTWSCDVLWVPRFLSAYCLLPHNFRCMASTQCAVVLYLVLGWPLKHYCFQHFWHLRIHSKKRQKATNLLKFNKAII